MCQNDINVIVVISFFLIQNINVEYISKDLILRNRCDSSVTSNSSTAEMVSKIFVSRQKLHSSLLPSVILHGHFNFAGIPRSGRYDRLTHHKKIAACDLQIFRLCLCMFDILWLCYLIFNWHIMLFKTYLH